MRVASIDIWPTSVPYRHAERSAQVNRGGVSDIIVRVTTDDGLVGWGESCCGADTASIVAALRAITPFVLGNSPWDSERIRADLWWRGLWQFRKQTASFAYAGIDMALWDICGRATGQPLSRLLGGPVRDEVDYFYYLDRGPDAHIQEQCTVGVEGGYEVFYLKVGLDDREDLRMVGAAREAIGPKRKLRLDANAAWSPRHARRMLDAMAQYDVDFVEQPVSESPPGLMSTLRGQSPIALCANEGMWTPADAVARIELGVADVYCFSPYWVGSLLEFQRVSWLVAQHGGEVCRHSHGELGIAAAAFQQVSLTVPCLVDGNQQSAQIMADDVLTTPLPIASGPRWHATDAPGLGVDVSEEKVRYYHEAFLQHGQHLPYGE